jgi:NAD(P)-dependent dehydrogenase (short-subunit alcohol dehydrogenase family)
MAGACRDNSRLSVVSSEDVCVAITGASSGLGRALAVFLGKRKIRVFGCGRRRAFVPLVDDYSVVDIRDAEAVRNWAQKISKLTPRLNMLVNNAAILGARKEFLAIEEMVWREALETNILGTAFVTRALFPLLIKSPHGTIVNTSSIMGHYGRAGWSTYSVSKFALEGLTQCLSQEFSRRGLSVVSLMPSRAPSRLRRLAYSRERLSKSGIDSYLNSVYWLLSNSATSLSGLSLSCEDLSFWGGRAK